MLALFASRVAYNSSHSHNGPLGRHAGMIGGEPRQNVDHGLRHMWAHMHNKVGLAELLSKQLRTPSRAASTYKLCMYKYLELGPPYEATRVYTYVHTHTKTCEPGLVVPIVLFEVLSSEFDM